MGDSDLIPESILEANTLIIQKTVNNIEDWLKKIIKGKKGILRGGLLSKRVDFSGRENIIPDDYIPLGFVGIPINHVLKFFDPFFVYHVLNVETSLQEGIKEFLNMDRNKKLDASDISNFITVVYNNPNNLVGDLYNKVKRAAEIITKDKVVIYKRDPTESRDTWISAYVRVDDTGYALRINPLDLCKNTGDFDGDAVSIFSLLTEEAQEQAKKFMNPIHSTSTWLRSSTSSSLVYNVAGDSLIGLYLATEN
jgi:DNA-directed RNA polymerase II subunit RPB1